MACCRMGSRRVEGGWRSRPGDRRMGGAGARQRNRRKNGSWAGARRKPAASRQGKGPNLQGSESTRWPSVPHRSKDPAGGPSKRKSDHRQASPPAPPSPGFSSRIPATGLSGQGPLLLSQDLPGGGGSAVSPSPPRDPAAAGGREAGSGGGSTEAGASAQLPFPAGFPSRPPPASPAPPAAPWAARYAPPRTRKSRHLQVPDPGTAGRRSRGQRPRARGAVGAQQQEKDVEEGGILVERPFLGVWGARTECELSSLISEQPGGGIVEDVPLTRVEATFFRLHLAIPAIRGRPSPALSPSPSPVRAAHLAPPPEEETQDRRDLGRSPTGGCG
ncbi:proline-rich proteoglycan 2-like [Elephas maximus indicus]|uniref:proline-rich proteoglycan 2-like n=1 Tax=Elephas maximus indicus TaxID=99487 RepID=UPI002116B41A|nr:proline-rich proteoglycan 2-like [Elephas maximus indicus]